MSLGSPRPTAFQDVEVEFFIVVVQFVFERLGGGTAGQNAREEVREEEEHKEGKREGTRNEEGSRFQKCHGYRHFTSVAVTVRFSVFPILMAIRASAVFAMTSTVNLFIRICMDPSCDCFHVY